MVRSVWQRQSAERTVCRMEEKVTGKNAIKEAYPVMVSFLDFYFRDRDITKIISMVDENMYFVGSRQRLYGSESGTISKTDGKGK